MTGYEDTQPGGGLAAQVEAVRRRALPMGIAFGAVLMLALLLAAFWPATYRSTGTILIEQQEIPEDFVRSAVSSYADQRVQVISQRVMTSANLLGIIEKFKLYGGERDTSTREALVERIRKDIKLDMISADVVDPRQGRATQATIAFAVGYDSRSPDLAARVANDLVSLYLRENLRVAQATRGRLGRLPHRRGREAAPAGGRTGAAHLRVQGEELRPPAGVRPVEHPGDEPCHGRTA